MQYVTETLEKRISIVNERYDFHDRLFLNILATASQPNESSLDIFLPSSSEEKKGDFPFDMDDLAGKVASKMAQKLDKQIKSLKVSHATTSHPESTTPSKASNLLEY